MYLFGEMIKSILAPRWAKILLGIVLLIIILTVIFQPSQPELTLTKTDPAVGQDKVEITGSITLTFNQSVQTKEFTITCSPDFDYQLQKKENRLTITPEKPLQPNQTYQISLQHKNWQKDLNFTTKPEVLPDKEISPVGDPEIEEEVSDYKSKNYPLFAVTPKKTPLWQADYIAPNKLLVVYDKEAELAAVKKEVFQWVESYQLPRDSHEYQWQEKK